MKQGEYILVNRKSNQSIIDFASKHDKIYRYLPMEFLMDMLFNKTNVFINPIKWNDPFDNYLFNFPKDSDETFTKDLFCQCLTLNPHSQAYWKTYGGTGFAARITLDTQSYLESLLLKTGEFYLGRMCYTRETKLVEELKNKVGLKSELFSSSFSNTFLDVFYLKRLPFEYEKEIRLLIKSKSTQSNLKRLKMELISNIKEIRLDPRMGNNEEKAWKDVLRKYSSKVTKSQLFTDKKIL